MSPVPLQKGNSTNTTTTTTSSVMANSQTISSSAQQAKTFTTSNTTAMVMTNYGVSKSNEKGHQEPHQQQQELKNETSAVKRQQQQKPLPNRNLNLTNSMTENLMKTNNNSSAAAMSDSESVSSSISSFKSNDNNCIIKVKKECDNNDNLVNSVVGSSSIKSEYSNDTLSQTNFESSDAVVANVVNTSAILSTRPHPVLLNSVNRHIMCNLCFGYLIDATTIVECLHSFCHSCLIKHLRTEQFCPSCEMMINTAKPNIKSDTTLQAIVYKLVPGLYERELMRKRAFYKDRPEEAALATPEQRGEDTEHLIFSPKDYMSLSLEYADREEHMGSNPEYIELLKPRYLQCPAMYTVAHLKKFVHGKFEIDTHRFTIDIMYKVKTIVLLDHYTLMDVAYIYTWKRDAPMRFYFRVKESLKPLVRRKRNLVNALSALSEATAEVVPIMAEQEIKIENPEIKEEIETTISTSHNAAVEEAQDNEPRNFEIVPQVLNTENGVQKDESFNKDSLKITLKTKSTKDNSMSVVADSPKLLTNIKEKKDHCSTPTAAVAVANIKEERGPPPKEERKVENIKLKIDLSKQNSVTIINMSDATRKEITKSLKPEKEWKIKSKKDSSPKSLSLSLNDKKGNKTPSPLTVPPLTIKAERISPLAKHSPKSLSNNSSPKTPKLLTAEEEKSQFLKSFALTPIKAAKLEGLTKDEYTKAQNISGNFNGNQKLSNASKRKSKEPVKAITKKPKLSPPLPSTDFKIKLPASPINMLKPPVAPSKPTTANNNNEKPLMPPPAPIAMMRPPIMPVKKTQKPSQKMAAPGSLTPHPMHGIQIAAPGNRTPIAKRYQPILPKASRPNPFANIPSDVNKKLKDAGTDIQSIGKEKSNKIYGPEKAMGIMGPPPSKATNHQSNTNRSSAGGGNQAKYATKSNNYLNFALMNSSKSRGNEVPPGCRTPMYTPNSPIYSPSSPQYNPSYNIPTMPTYKYTPKPSGGANNYLQSVLGSNNNGLFPGPPTKNEAAKTDGVPQQRPKHVYPFAKSPSPPEDPPEKQLKVKSLLNSCNINIPSSLSITITREDGEAGSNSTSYPKHKSPVNNYIEIVKLPDQTAEASQHENNKRQSPPSQAIKQPAMSLYAQLNNKKEAANKQPDMKLSSSMPVLPVKNQNNSNTNDNKNNIKLPACSITKTSNMNTTSNGMQGGNAAKAFSPPLTVVATNTATKPAVSAKVFSSKPNDQKPNSPEKRSADQMMVTTSPEKSPKSPNNEASQAAKKFRPILPRQNQEKNSEVVPPKATSAEVIGTYNSQTGVTYKVHANNKKVPTAKKSPNTPMQQQQSPSQPSTPQTMAQRSPLQNNSTKPTQNSSSNKTAVVSAANNQNKNQIKANGKKTATNAASPSTNNKLSPHTIPHPVALAATLPNLTHPMQALNALNASPHHLGMNVGSVSPNAAAVAQALLKDNLLRAQVQATANQYNMLYSHANAAAAAQMGQFTPSMAYNYQQAYIMEQLSRMQRAAGSEAFNEYMQSLKNGSAETGLVEPPNNCSPKAATTTPTISAKKTSSPINSGNKSTTTTTTKTQSSSKAK